MTGPCFGCYAPFAWGKGGKEEDKEMALVLLRSGHGWRGADRQARGGAGSRLTAMTPPNIGLCYAVLPKATLRRAGLTGLCFDICLGLGFRFECEFGLVLGFCCVQYRPD